MTEEYRLIRECFIPNALGDMREACAFLDLAIEDSVSVSVSSDPSFVEGHPAYKAFVAMGIPALDWLMNDLDFGNEPSWWKLMAADKILDSFGVKHELPEKLRGRLVPQARHLRQFLKKAFRKGGVLYSYTVYPNNCACGKKGEWIADGISRYGFYCKKCSAKALEEA
jgi:hypothetical protein